MGLKSFFQKIIPNEVKKVVPNELKNGAGIALAATIFVPGVGAAVWGAAQSVISGMTAVGTAIGGGSLVSGGIGLATQALRTKQATAQAHLMGTSQDRTNSMFYSLPSSGYSTGGYNSGELSSGGGGYFGGGGESINFIPWLIGGVFLIMLIIFSRK